MGELGDYLARHLREVADRVPASGGIPTGLLEAVAHRRRARARIRAGVAAITLTFAVGGGAFVASSGGDDSTVTADRGDPSTTSTSSGPATGAGLCPLNASFPIGPDGWDMTVRPGPGSGDGPSTWWHIAGPSDGFFIDILRGSTPFPPGEAPRPFQVGDKIVSVYPTHEGFAASMHRAVDDPTSACGELHLLGYGISEAELQALATDTVLAPAGAGPTAVQLADLLACSDRVDREWDRGEPVEPADALDCRVGESAIGIQTYRSVDDRQQVLTYLHQFTGFRVAGDSWLISTDTPEAAADVARLTGGRFVPLAGRSNSICLPLRGDEPTTAMWVVTGVPDGFAADPASTGASDDATVALSFNDDGGSRRIEIHELTSEEDPDGALTNVLRRFSAHESIQSVDQCGPTEPGEAIVVPVDFRVARGTQGTAIGTRTWEYGGLYLTGNEGVSLEDLLVVAAGLRLRTDT